MQIKFPALFLGIMLFCSAYCFGQHKFDCESISNVPFKEDSVFSEMTQILLKKKVLLPIRESNADFEIRIHYSPYNMPGPTIVIKCEDDKMFATKYVLGFNSLKKPYKFKGHTSLGPMDSVPGIDVMYTKSRVKPHGLTWEEVLNELAENRFFDSVNETELKKIITKAHPNIQEGWHHGATYVQIKVGKRFRNMIFSLSYTPLPPDIPEYRQRININEILNRIY